MNKYILKFLVVSSYVLLCHTSNAADHLSVMFTAGWDPIAAQLAKDSLDEQDFIGKNLDNDRAISFTLPPNLEMLSRHSALPCIQGEATQVIIYDPEHWDSTSADERSNLPKSIAEAARLVQTSGCRIFGLAPDGEFIGLMPGACSATPGKLLTQIDWRKVSYLILQSQRLLSTKCGGAANLAQYQNFVTQWSRAVKRRNPAIRIFPSLTFRYIDPATMQEAIRITRSEVDGFYLAYPNSEKGVSCRYCTAENLKRVIGIVHNTKVH